MMIFDNNNRIDNSAFGKGTGRIGNQIKNRDHSYNNIIEISQNTETSPGDLGRLAITSTAEKTIC